MVPSETATQAVIQEFRKNPDIASSVAVFDAGESDYLARQTSAPELARALKIRTSSLESLERLRKWSHAHGDLFQFEENAPVTLNESPAVPTSAADPLLKEQWGLRNTGGTYLLKTSDIQGIPFQGVPDEDVGVDRAPPENLSRPIVVGVLDTGIDVTHPDLQSQIYRKESECQAYQQFLACKDKEKNEEKCLGIWGKVDTDGNGYPMDCMGWNVLSLVDRQTGIRGNNQIDDDIGHGTHVSGIIAAAQNSVGIRGVSQSAKILSIKVIRESEPEPARPADADSDVPPSIIERDLPKIRTYADIISRGMLYALRSNVQVINMSLNWPRYMDSLLMRKLVKAIQNKGVLVVAAADNFANPNPVYPCLYDGVVCVGSHGPDGALSQFSNYGGSVDVAAPGFMILSTWFRQCMKPECKQKFYTDRIGYDFRSGTSMAAPMTAGVLARILNSGASSDEAYARLMIGTRPVRTSTVDIASGKKWVRNGNIDLARSLNALPRPWIAPVKKEVVFLTWDRKSNHLAIKLDLKNFWMAAENVAAEIKLSALALERGFSLPTSRFELGSLSSGETKKLSGTLQISHSEIPSEIEFELNLTADGIAQPPVHMQAEVIVPLDPLFLDSESETLTLSTEDAALIRDSEGITDIRWIQPVFENFSPTADPQYVAIKKTGAKSTAAFLLQRLGQTYKVSASHTFDEASTNVQNIYQTETGFVWSTRTQIEKTGKSGRKDKFAVLHWLNLNSQFQPIGTEYQYDGSLGFYPGSVFWIWLSGERVPAWIAMGKLPDPEKPKPTPWEKNPENPAARRVYYVNATGVHTLPHPQDFAPVEWLSSHEATFTTGKGYDRKFFRSSFDSNGIWQTPAALNFPSYHMIGGLVPTMILSLDKTAAGSSAGVAYGSQGVLGQHRLSLVLPDQTQVQQITIAPEDPLAAIHRMVGVYRDAAGGIQAFGQSLFQIDFQDFSSGLHASTTIKRFGFVSKNLFDGYYYPLSVDSNGASRIPALYFPPSLGVSISSELIVPALSSDGKELRLERPAKFRIFPTAGKEQTCTELNPTPTHLVYFCGDRFIKLPLRFKNAH